MNTPKLKRNVLELTFNAKNNSKKEVYVGNSELKITNANGNQYKEYFSKKRAFVNENISLCN